MNLVLPLARILPTAEAIYYKQAEYAEDCVKLSFYLEFHLRTLLFHHYRYHLFLTPLFLHARTEH